MKHAVGETEDIDDDSIQVDFYLFSFARYFNLLVFEKRVGDKMSRWLFEVVDDISRFSVHRSVVLHVIQRERNTWMTWI